MVNNVNVCTARHAEADLGMFSMFDRTGAPQENRQIFITEYSLNVG